MERDPRKCRGTKKNGEPCQKWPIKGGAVCGTHGGGARQVKEKAAQRVQEAAARKALGDVPAENVDPAEALLRLVSMKWAEIHWLRTKVQDVGEQQAEAEHGAGHGGPGDPLAYGLTKHDTGIGPQGPVDQRTYQSEPNVWWRLLREAEDQLAKYSTAALRAGVERRQIELQEAQAVHLAAAINRILDALELTAEQARKVPEIVPAVLRDLPMERKD